MVLFKGKLKPKDLDQDLILYTFNVLSGAAQSGYGKKWIKFDSKYSKTYDQLIKNLYRFSAAKTYQQLKEMNAALLDGNGKIRNFTDFKNAVLKVSKTYNKTYLKNEYQTAKNSAQMARKWQGFEGDKDLFPNLMYRTVGDSRVREEHQKLDSIIKPLNDQFWDTHYPPNGWLCRCSVQQTDKPVSPGAIKIKIDPKFRNNVGKTKVTFNEKKHPYFVIPKGEKVPLNKK